MATQIGTSTMVTVVDYLKILHFMNLWLSAYDTCGLLCYSLWHVLRAVRLFDISSKYQVPHRWYSGVSIGSEKVIRSIGIIFYQVPSSHTVAI